MATASLNPPPENVDVISATRKRNNGRKKKLRTGIGPRNRVSTSAKWCPPPVSTAARSGPPRCGPHEAVLKVRLLAAGFVIGCRGVSARQISHVTGTVICSWTDCDTSYRIFRIHGGSCASVAAAVGIIDQAVATYTMLCQHKQLGEYVDRVHVIGRVAFRYRPPPKTTLDSHLRFLPRQLGFHHPLCPLHQRYVQLSQMMPRHHVTQIATCWPSSMPRQPSRNNSNFTEAANLRAPNLKPPNQQKSVSEFSFFTSDFEESSLLELKKSMVNNTESVSGSSETQNDDGSPLPSCTAFDYSSIDLFSLAPLLNISKLASGILCGGC